MKYLYNPPSIIKKTFSSFKWNSSNGRILLTFDDGPSPEATENILNVLKENKIKAAFFCVGNNVLKYPDLTGHIINDGHLVGNHTFNHMQLTKLTYPESLIEINSFNQLLIEKHSYNVRFFRPPHGKFKINTPFLIRKCGLVNVMWSMLTYDFKEDLKEVNLAVNKYLRKDSIVVLHDSTKTAKIIQDSIEIVLEIAGKKGLEIGEPAECLR